MAENLEKSKRDGGRSTLPEIPERVRQEMYARISAIIRQTRQFKMAAAVHKQQMRMPICKSYLISLLGEQLQAQNGFTGDIKFNNATFSDSVAYTFAGPHQQAMRA